MKAIATIGAVALALAFAMPAGATEGFADFRILVQGDFGAVALSSFCADPSYPSPPDGPVVNPDDPEGTAFSVIDAPFLWECWVLKDNAGYDGETGAAWDSSGHEDHDFTCAVTSSATPGVESITVGFDNDGDTFIDADAGFPNTVWRPLDEFGILPGGVDLEDNPTGVPDVDNQVPNGANPGLRDGFLVTAALRGHFWPVVDGTILGAFAVIFDHAGADLTVECTY